MVIITIRATQKKIMSKPVTKTSRETFLIDPKGTIVYHYNSVNPESHATQVLADVAKLAKK